MQRRARACAALGLSRQLTTSSTQTARCSTPSAGSLFSRAPAGPMAHLQCFRLPGCDSMQAHLHAAQGQSVCSAGALQAVHHQQRTGRTVQQAVSQQPFQQGTGTAFAVSEAVRVC